ncbi:MAG: type II toxin-antitoxin system HicA family toxin [Planctomycetes bacterium]|nr:type II toxin-antitoxin system HicA family toxin [Planctomycetota bacterium]
MAGWRPCKRRDFIRRLRKLGFEGPYSGARHEFLVRAGHRLAVPSNAEYSVPQLAMMMREVSSILGRFVSAAEWDSLR